MHLEGCDHHQVAQRGLVEHGERHAQDQHRRHDLLELVMDELRPLGKPELRCLVADEGFAKDGREFDVLHREIDHHAQADLEQHRVALPHVRHHGVPDVVPAADIGQEPRDIEGVPKQRRQQGGTCDGVVMLAMEYVHKRRGDEAAAREGDAAADVHGDPQAPGMLLVQVCRGSEAEDEPVQHEAGADQHRRQQQEDTRRPQFSPRRLSLRMMGVRGMP